MYIKKKNNNNKAGTCESTTQAKNQDTASLLEALTWPSYCSLFPPCKGSQALLQVLYFILFLLRHLYLNNVFLVFLFSGIKSLYGKFYIWHLSLNVHLQDSTKLMCRAIICSFHCYLIFHYMNMSFFLIFRLYICIECNFYAVEYAHSLLRTLSAGKKYVTLIKNGSNNKNT